MSNERELIPTPQQVKGPYFLANSPFRRTLIPKGLTGQKLVLSGQVLDTAGNTIAGAIVHLWIADPSGRYDNQLDNGAPSQLDPSQHKLRGRQHTNKNGCYRWIFLRPGNYPLVPGGSQKRPAHLHVMIEAPGYKTLVTQIYMPDDYWNTRDIKDGREDDFFQPELIVHLAPAVPHGKQTQVGTFNFVLSKS